MFEQFTELEMNTNLIFLPTGGVIVEIDGETASLFCQLPEIADTHDFDDMMHGDSDEWHHEDGDDMDELHD